MSNGHWVLL